jgi:preprotein translocase subunit SecF
MKFFGKTEIDFLAKRRAAFFLSGILILTAIVSLVARGGLKLGLDFSGGMLVQIKFQEEISIERIREALAEVGLEKSIIQEFGKKENREIVIRFKAEEEVGELEEILSKSFGSLELRRNEKVAPVVGKELRQRALLALAWALIGMLAYISWRFEFKFAIGAVIALFHDIFITVGFFSLTGREFSIPIIASLLIIVGYSLNDTIVIYDRVRENLHLMRKDSYGTILNRSINQSLSRTINTSLTTLFVVLALYFLGGEIIRDFAFALLVGVIVGTYSSSFVAIPIVYEWQGKGKK